jgi:hypothetical protein
VKPNDLGLLPYNVLNMREVDAKGVNETANEKFYHQPYQKFEQWIA